MRAAALSNAIYPRAFPRSGQRAVSIASVTLEGGSSNGGRVKGGHAKGGRVKRGRHQSSQLAPLAELVASSRALAQRSSAWLARDDMPLAKARGGATPRIWA